jgi:pyruvate-formate lyase
MEFLKKLLIKKLGKKGKKNGAKILQEKTKWGWNKKNVLQIKKIAIQRIRTKLERLKNYRGEI